jgi:uncharacterized damage-inducible protein DinB
MAITRQLLLCDVDYSAWANRQLLEACTPLPHAHLDRDLGASHRGVLETLRHIFYTERVWRDRLIANALPPLIVIGDQRLFQDPPPGPSLEDLKQRWPEIEVSLHQWLANLPESELSGELPCLQPDGQYLRLSRWQIILHMVNHSTLHRGQIISMLRTLELKPPNIDLFSFYMAQN